MTVDGIFPSNRVSIDGGGEEDEDDDLLPLSKIFPTRELGKGFSQNAGVAAADGGGLSIPVGGCSVSRVPVVSEVEGRENGSSSYGHRGSFRTGDIVWAKAFPYTWWPGWVQRSKDSIFLVSFFGGERSQWFQESKIRGFEENYVLMSKMAGANLADDVGCALAEVSRRAALGLRCSCQSLVKGIGSPFIGQIAKARKEFDPAGMLGFVLDMAVSPWVSDAETVRAARVYAQVSEYRHHASVARIDEVNEVFAPAEMLDVVLGMAVSAWVSNEEEVQTARVVAQVKAYRYFISINPEWVYQIRTGEGDSSAGEDSEGSHSEMPSGLLSENKEIEDSDSSYENELEELEVEHTAFQENIPGDEGFCMVNRVDYSVFSSDEFEFHLDNEKEDICDWSESVGVGFGLKKKLEVKKAASSDASHLSNESPNFERLLSLSKDTSKKYQDNKINDTNEVSSKVDVSSYINFAKPCVSTDMSDSAVDESKIIGRTSFLEERFHGRDFDQPVASGLSFELHKTDDLSSAHESNACFLNFRTETSSHLSVDFSLEPQLMPVAGICHGKEGSIQPLHESLWYLHCLALDPFYLGSPNLMSICQGFLSFRTSVFQNIHDFFSGTYSSEDNQKVEAQELFRHDHLMHINNVTAETPPDYKVGDICEASSEAQSLSPTCYDGIELQAGDKFSSEAPQVSHDTDDVVSDKFRREAPQVSHDTDDVVGIQSSAKVSIAGRIVVDKRYTAADSNGIKRISRLTFPVNGEGVIQKRRFDQAVTSDNSFNLHKTHSLGSEAKLYTSPLMPDNTNSTLMLDNTNSTGKKTDFCAEFSVLSHLTEKDMFLDNAGYNVMKFQSNGSVCAAANIIDAKSDNPKVSCSSVLPMCRSRHSFFRKRRFDQPILSDLSKRRKTCLSHFASTAKFYVSPLVMDTPNPTSRARQPPVMDRHTGLSKSLHMKFPKDFNLPSKEELEKLFGNFGPLDHSRTEVFFYTGAGKVVFLNSADAEAAYNYVKRKKVFGQAIMCFWLDAHENFRKGN